MRLAKWGKKQSVGGAGYMLQLDSKEAIRLIESLSNQLMANDPNTGRWEPWLDTGESFSISVSDHRPKVKKE